MVAARDTFIGDLIPNARRPYDVDHDTSHARPSAAPCDPDPTVRQGNVTALSRCLGFAMLQALSMAFSAGLSAAYILSSSFFGGRGIDLVDVWTGLAVLQGSRAVTFSFRHWFDTRGPLANQARGDGSHMASLAGGKQGRRDASDDNTADRLE